MTACRRCGCRLARDHDDGDELCSPCSRSVVRDYDPAPREDPLYDPHEDPDFYDRLLRCLEGAFGETIDPLKEMGIDRCYRRYMHSGVRALRRAGFDIRATPKQRGFRFVGYLEPSHFFPDEGGQG